MIVSVSAAMGKSPSWLMDNMTVSQLGLYFEKIKRERMDYLEYHASVIWAMASGKFRKTRKVSAEDLAAQGLIKEE